MEIFLWLVAGHFIGDFPFQNEWMVTQKGKSWEVNLYHALVYTSAILVVAGIGGFNLPFSAVVILAASHFLIDPLKARWNIVKYIWLDQILHLIVLATLLFFVI